MGGDEVWGRPHTGACNYAYFCSHCYLPILPATQLMQEASAELQAKLRARDDAVIQGHMQDGGLIVERDPERVMGTTSSHQNGGLIEEQDPERVMMGSWY